MKITIVQGAFFPVPPVLGGAVEKVWFALGKEFARRGHEVVHVSRAYPGLPARETLDGVVHLRTSGFAAPRHLVLLKFLDLLFSLRARALLPRADIVVTNTFWLPLLIRSEIFGKLYVHVQRFPKGQMRFYRHASRVQSVSMHIQRAILAEAPCLAGKVSVIPNPIWSPIPDEAPPKASREKRILFVGRVHPEKGLELLVKAVGRVAAEVFAGWKLIVVGPSAVSSGGGGEEFLAHLQDLARSFRERIEFVGPVFEADALIAEYRRAAIFVYPSIADQGEASPLAPLEAMAQGCPTLVSDLECFRDYLTDGVTGFVFDHRPPDPAAALASVLAHLISSPARLTEVGRAGQRRAADFSIERVADRYLQDFESLLAGQDSCGESGLSTPP